MAIPKRAAPTYWYNPYGKVHGTGSVAGIVSIEQA